MDFIEIYKPINGYEGFYEISDKGRVKSFYSKRGKLGKAKILKLQLNNKGYCRATLCKDKIQLKKFVHRLVAESFIPNTESKSVINHIDNNPKNNNVENLEWATPSENMQHCIKQQRNSPTRGEKNYLSKFTNDQIKKIRRIFEARNISKREMAKNFNVSHTTMIGVLNNLRYKEA